MPRMKADRLRGGAEAGTRTPMALRPLAPEASASANSATSACGPFRDRQEPSLYHADFIAGLTRAHQCGDDQVAADVDRGAAHVEKAVDPEDQSHPLGR